MALASPKSSTAYDPPSANQLEISLFGPGYGECLVVHYGNGRWFTVDSCLEDDRQTPSALAYLNHLGTDPSECVTHNIVTHPDGDHLGGISTLFSACSSARLVCPTILAEREVVSYTTYYARTDPTPLARTTREIYDVLKLSLDRPPNAPLRVKQDTLIIQEAGVRVTALAPSDTKVERFLARISQQIPKKGLDRRAPRKLLPNDVSLALLVEFGQVAAVFGADLEETPGQGWTTIHSTSLAFKNAVAPRAFKVAHHGSEDADCPAIWSAMDNPVAILAPFKLGSIRIPTPDDVERILRKTDRAYSTSSFKTQTVKRLSRTDKILIGHRIRRQELYPKNGHIRLRVDIDNNVNVDLFDGAVHLSAVH